MCEPDNAAGGHDLDLDYETPEKALAAFGAVESENGVDTLLDHTKEYYSDIIASQNVIRDKAKLILGATSFTLAMFSGGVALLKESFDNAPTWLVALMALLFILVAIHFARALLFALDAITREVTCAVSTQDVVAAVAVAEPGSAEVKRRLASDYRSAATQTAKHLTERKLSLMLAQGCLKWGLLLMPGLFFCSLLAAYSKPKTETPAWAKPLVSTVDDLKGVHEASRARLDSLDRRLATLDGAGLAGRVRDLERQLRDADQRHAGVAQELKVLAAATQSAQADLRLALERVGNDGRDVQGRVQSFSDRMRKLEEQMEKVSRQLQDPAKPKTVAPGASGDKKQ